MKTKSNFTIFISNIEIGKKIECFFTKRKLIVKEKNIKENKIKLKEKTSKNSNWFSQVDFIEINNTFKFLH